METNQKATKQCILLLDIGATNTRLAIVDKGNTTFHKNKKIKTPKKNFLILLKKEIRDFITNQNIYKISISVAGPVKNQSVTLTNIKEKSVLMSKDFNDICDDVFLINDANAAALAESKLLKYKNLIYITISSGIGVGIVKNNKILTSKSDQELGHIVINSDYQVNCGCGGQNHWEAFSSGNNITNFYYAWAKANNKKPVKYNSAGDLFDAARVENSPERDFIINEIGKTNSIAISYLHDKYTPEIIVLGGAVALNNKELIMAGLSQEIREKTKLIITSQKDNICLLGAFYYAKNI